MNNTITKESLQEYCDKKDFKVKILFVERSEHNLYEVIYTFDLEYDPKDRDYAHSGYIIEPEHDELVEDEQDFLGSAAITLCKVIWESNKTREDCTCNECENPKGYCYLVCKEYKEWLSEKDMSV